MVEEKAQKWFKELERYTSKNTWSMEYFGF